MNVDYAELIREARRTGHFVAGTTPLRMTPILFGKLLAATWASRIGRSDLPRSEDVMAALMAAADTIPDDLKAVMHVEPRITGHVIAEYDEYLAGARMDGLIEVGSGTRRHAVTMDRSTGQTIVDDIVRGRHDMAEWISGVVDRLAAPAQEGSRVRG